MKPGKYSFPLLVLAAFFSPLIHAQDYIHKHDGEVLEVKVRKIGTQEIVYTELMDSTVEIAIAVSEVAEINMESGRRYTYEAPNPDLQIFDPTDQRERAIKFGFLTPLSGSFRVEFDRHIRQGQIFYSSINFIGIGFDPADLNPRGLGLSIGYKFLSTPDYYTATSRRAHIMKGGYIMPQMVFSSFGEDRYWAYYDPNTGQFREGTAREVSTGGAILVNIGKQWVFGSSMVVDFSVGLGYGFASVKSDAPKGYQDEWDIEIGRRMHGFTHFGSDVPLALGSRLSIGFLF